MSERRATRDGSGGDSAKRVAVVGASGKTGRQLVEEALARGWEVAAVCRAASAAKLHAYQDVPGFTLHTGPQVSDPETLRRALAGCDAVAVILMSVRGLKATDMVQALRGIADTDGPRRVVFTSGEVTFVPEVGERYTFRQRLLSVLARLLAAQWPYSVTDMLRASRQIRDHDWEWTAVRAPTLVDAAPTGYIRCALSDIMGSHRLTRRDYARALLEVLDAPQTVRKAVTVRPA